MRKSERRTYRATRAVVAGLSVRPCSTPKPAHNLTSSQIEGARARQNCAAQAQPQTWRTPRARRACLRLAERRERPEPLYLPTLSQRDTRPSGNRKAAARSRNSLVPYAHIERAPRDWIAPSDMTHRRRPAHPTAGRLSPSGANDPCRPSRARPSQPPPTAEKSALAPLRSPGRTPELLGDLSV